jgi:hypothetical protein
MTRRPINYISEMPAWEAMGDASWDCTRHDPYVCGVRSADHQLRCTRIAEHYGDHLSIEPRWDFDRGGPTCDVLERWVNEEPGAYMTPQELLDELVHLYEELT